MEHPEQQLEEWKNIVFPSTEDEEIINANKLLK